jgi:hypothetical protein
LAELPLHPRRAIAAFDPQGLITTDLDGDGNLIWLLPIHRQGSWCALSIRVAYRKSSAPAASTSFWSGDWRFHTDGKPDLAIANYGNGHVTILTNLPGDMRAAVKLQ